ncbi:hypothetical protein OSTOST_04283 [Ostertagia ostertagi]
MIGGECVKRRLMCDGFPDCENGADENPKMLCKYPDLSGRIPVLSSDVVYTFLGISILNYALCGSGRLDTTSSVHQLRGSGMAEASILLPPHAQTGTQVEVALRTYSVVTSTNSSYPALPPPNSTRSLSHSSGSRNRSDVKDIPLNRFYAPPPSAASLSTYGVVKPAEARGSCNVDVSGWADELSSTDEFYSEISSRIHTTVVETSGCDPSRHTVASIECRVLGSSSSNNFLKFTL